MHELAGRAVDAGVTKTLESRWVQIIPRLGLSTRNGARVERCDDGKHERVTPGVFDECAVTVHALVLRRIMGKRLVDRHDRERQTTKRAFL